MKTLRRRSLLMAGALTLTPGIARAASGRAAPAGRLRARDLGLAPGVLPPGALNALTDVAGVRVGQVTLVEGDRVRTGVTAILPHGGNLFQDKVPAGLAVANGFGKLAGATQIVELGEIETPIVLTNTLAVPRAAEAIIDWTLSRPGNEAVRSVNAVVGETNDGRLNDIRARPVTVAHVRDAIDRGRTGPVEEGAVGAGTGTVAFGWKGGVGTSSRRLPAALGGHTLGVLVQTNFGGVLSIGGAPVGRELGRYHLREYVEDQSADGSIMIVVATDAPLGDRNLTRLARRAMAGVRAQDRPSPTAPATTPWPSRPPGRCAGRRSAAAGCPPTTNSATTRSRRSSPPPSRRPKRRSTTPCSWPGRCGASTRRPDGRSSSRRSISTPCGGVSRPTAWSVRRRRRRRSPGPVRRFSTVCWRGRATTVRSAPSRNVPDATTTCSPPSRAGMPSTGASGRGPGRPWPPTTRSWSASAPRRWRRPARSSPARPPAAW